MEFWERVQKDVSKGLRESFEVIRVKASELPDEGRKRYNIYDIKSHIHKHMAELGAALYSMKDSGKDPLSSTKITRLIKKISKLEGELGELEPSLVKKRKPAKKSPAKKVKKKAKKKAAK